MIESFTMRRTSSKNPAEDDARSSLWSSDDDGHWTTVGRIEDVGLGGSWWVWDVDS